MCPLNMTQQIVPPAKPHCKRCHWTGLQARSLPVSDQNHADPQAHNLWVQVISIYGAVMFRI